MCNITQKRLKEILDYEPETGIFKWKINIKSVKAGNLVGCCKTKINRQIKINGKHYSANQIAWLYVYGNRPKRLWHINGNVKDFSIKNLTDIKPEKEKIPLTQKRVKDCLDYNPDTGIFIWKKRTGNVSPGTIAGSFTDGKYSTISIDGNRLLAHRLAWFYVYGYFPENQIDHINRIKTDNSIKNLREVSPSCNMRNTGNQKNNTSGINGVYWYARYNLWCAQIKINKKTIPLGRFKTFEEAVEARYTAEKKANWEQCAHISPAHEYLIKKGKIK